MPFLLHGGIRETFTQPALDELNEIGQQEQTSNTIPLIPAEECIPASGLRRSRGKLLVTDGPFAETKDFAAG